MYEIFVEFDLLDYGYATAYYYVNNKKQAIKEVTEELKVWGGGHADVYEDGEFLFDVEV